MITKEELKKIIILQKEELMQKEIGIERELMQNIDLSTKHAIILSGIRRCGKSTLMQQLMKTDEKINYFNFEDYRALNFELSDFQKLDEIFEELHGKEAYYFFDEIQNIDKWELFIRTKLDQGKKCIITGSNASLLSKELGTKLTGRHLTYELFPFSYKEFLTYTKKKQSLQSFEEYFESGGFPEFLKEKNSEILRLLLNNILTRDIIVRHKIRETKTIQQLLIYLLTNISREFSYNELAKTFNAGSPTSIINYISFFEDSYLLFTVPKFDYSYRKQLVNPKKIYSIDAGLIKTNAITFSSDNGRILENIIFLQLRRKYTEIYYFKNKHECDFIVRQKGKLLFAIQVCYLVNEENMQRELNGLKEAMDALKIKNGIIITFNQEDVLDKIKLIPAWKWLLDN